MVNQGLYFTLRSVLSLALITPIMASAQSFNIPVGNTPVGVALDNTEIFFFANDFVVDTSDSTLGGTSMKSRFNGTGVAPSIGAFVEGDVTLTFDYKFEREFLGAELTLNVFDFAGLAFEEKIASVSFDGWRTKSVYLPEGVEQIMWSLNQFSEATKASIDNVRIEPGNTLPDTETFISKNSCNSENPFFDDSLANAVDNTKIEFFSDQTFFQQIEVSFFGDDSAQTIETQFGDTISFGSIIKSTTERELEFFWKVSSTRNRASLEFEIFDSDFRPIGIKSSISGELDWALKQFTIPKGQHILLWRFVNNSRNLSDINIGWIDKISIDGEFDPLCRSSDITPIINLLLDQ